ncbi:MAG: endonuclease/exonuclease/phosphatase family protein [Dermatophilaceae bacterium]
MQGIRVATYNTRGFLDDWRLAARLVQVVDPDVLCLQEVARLLGGGWRTRLFARHCRMSWAGSHHGGGGTTVFTSSRVRLVGARHLRLPVQWPDRMRGFTVARVATRSGAEVTVASVHLSLRPPERIIHAERILATLADQGPLVLAGDVNEGPAGAAWQVLEAPERLRLVSPSRPTFPARRPRHRIDAIFAAPEVVALPHRDVAVPDDVWARASDHRPVWADLVVPPTRG